jgi:hypothetical protein
MRRAGVAVRHVTMIASPSRRVRTALGRGIASAGRARTRTVRDAVAILRPFGAAARTTTRTGPWRAYGRTAP